MTQISRVYARQILDSRGNPTVEADIETTDGFMGRAAVPSGASTGVREALELRDGRKEKYLGKSVETAVQNIADKIAPSLKGVDIFDQKKIDQIMLDLDGSHEKKNLGANAILAVSLAVARTGALSKKKTLFRYLREDLHAPYRGKGYELPNPLMNIINGGAHASNNLDIQEFMILPHMRKSFAENLRAGVEIFHHLKQVLSTNGHATNVGDEGGFAPNFKQHKEALDTITQAIEKAGYKPGEEISFSLDSAASEFYKDGKYHFQNELLSASDMVAYYKDLINEYPLYSIEDGLGEDDYQGWIQLTKELGDKVQLVGDDLFVTNKAILAEGISGKWANSILIKVNQIGTLSETFETMKLAYEENMNCIISHRSGETGDSFIADLAVATNSGHIKTGSASRSDRMEKYNQLLRIEEELGSEALYTPVKN